MMRIIIDWEGLQIERLRIKFRSSCMRLTLYLFILLTHLSHVYGQGIQSPGIKLFGPSLNQSITSLHKGNYILETGLLQKNISRRNNADTLSLPFFDDFTTTAVYPDTRLWMDSQVYVNSHFPLSPPSYGVATFDQLDSKGRPYSDLFNPLLFSSWDTLTSRPINLSFYKIGNQEVNYSIGDSLYLSFFFQGGGLGDKPEFADSFVLQFKLPSGIWRNIWTQRVMNVTTFKQILIPVTDPLYFFNGFQFRFVHFTYALGNLNQVHLDYVRLNRNRSVSDTLINDVAIQAGPFSLLRYYHQMPYLHFLADSANQKAASHTLSVRNNGAQIVNTQFAFDATAFSNTIASFPFSSSNRNIFPHADTVESFSSFPFANLNANSFVRIDKRYRINPLAGNTTPDVYNALGNNDEYNSIQHFKNQYAYDDGTAEGGIGLSYEGLPPGRGSFALRYNLSKSDTLSGIAIFFNRSLENISSRSFRICIWRGLAEGVAEDKPIYELSILAPPYTDSINGFHHFILDTLIVLPKGDFYIGWSQTAIYNLNVGYDNNYRKDGIEQRNDNILFNLLGTWQRADASIKGTPMIRPIVGAYSLYPLQVKEQTKRVDHVKQFQCTPNPVSESLRFTSLQPYEEALLEIRDIQGRLIVKETLLASDYNLETASWVKGIYIVYLRMKNGVQIEKIIKN